MAKPLSPDICVVGAGPTGLALAVGAAACGAGVVLVDKITPRENLERGDLAAATFGEAARRANALRMAARAGALQDEPKIDFRAVIVQIGQVVADAAPAISPERLAALGIAFINAPARFTGRRGIVAGETEIRARRYVLATGSVPLVPGIPGLEETGFLTADTIFGIGRRPSHLVIIGGDPSGLELAQAFRRLGSQVTLIAQDGILPGEDREMSAVVVSRLVEEGVTVLEGTTATEVQRRGKTGVKVLTETAGATGEVDGSHLLLAMGRRADVDELDLKKARIAMAGGSVDVSAMLRTTNRKVYAIGDAAGARSVQAGRHQAELVLKALLYRLPAKDRGLVPRAVATEPEFAAIGLSEDEAMRSHRRLTIQRWPYAENGRARAAGLTDGHLKLVVAANGDLLGVSIVGAGASEAIATWALAMSKGLRLRDMASSIPAHPTIAEVGKNAAMAYFAGRRRQSLKLGIARLLRLLG